MASPSRTALASLDPAECITQPSCQAMSPSCSLSSCTVREETKRAKSQPQRDARSRSYHSKTRRCERWRYCRVPISRPIADSGIHPCTVRSDGWSSGSPMASSSRCQCVSKSPGSLEKPRSISTHKSEEPASSLAARQSSPFLSATKEATSLSSSWMAKVKRTSFWPPASLKAVCPCSFMSLVSEPATDTISVRFSTPRVMTWPLLW
mmetsp:Transcript_40105/g.106153  ORF Transcript_40105/g.106153 Transcript_40105/m.106153 type:complete len:207 (-) Transcript_40105:184-804(-)